MLAVALPALERRAANPVDARTVPFVVAPERVIEESLRLVARNGRMPEIELVLAVNVREIHIEQPAFTRHLAIERRSRHWRVQHELMEVRVVLDRVLDFAIN